MSGAAQPGLDQAYRHRDGTDQGEHGLEAGPHGGRVMLEPGERGRGYLADRFRERRRGPARQVRGQHEEAQGRDAQHVADDKLVHVGDGERDHAGSGQRQAEPEERPGLAAVEPEPQRLRREADQQAHRGQAARQPADRQAHRAEAAQGQDQGQQHAQPDVHLVSHGPLVLAEVALQQPDGGGGEAVDQDHQGEDPDHPVAAGAPIAAEYPGAPRSRPHRAHCW